MGYENEHSSNHNEKTIIICDLYRELLFNSLFFVSNWYLHIFNFQFYTIQSCNIMGYENEHSTNHNGKTIKHPRRMS